MFVENPVISCSPSSRENDTTNGVKPPACTFTAPAVNDRTNPARTPLHRPRNPSNTNTDESPSFKRVREQFHTSHQRPTTLRGHQLSPRTTKEAQLEVFKRQLRVIIKHRRHLPRLFVKAHLPRELHNHPGFGIFHEDIHRQ
jgi:hypothetical protein